MLTFLDYLLLASYLLLLLGVGAYFARRERSIDDFFLAGRRMPWWAAGVSIFGTQLSAITFLAVPAKAFATDWVYFLVNMTIILVTPIVIYVYLPVFYRSGVTSAYEYLENRFNVWVRIFGSMAFLLLQVARIGIVLFLPAITLATVTGMDVYTCILLMGVLATLYTALGGIEAVIWTDVSQVVILVGGALLSLMVIASSVDGGIGTIVSTGWADKKFQMFNWTWDMTVDAVWVVVIGNIFANLIPYTADQAVIQRYLTTPSRKDAARAVWTNAVLTFPASLLFFGLGTALYVFYNEFPGLLSPTVHHDGIFPLFIVQQLPPGVSGIVVAGVFAASMSSLDSGLNSMATVVVTDYYRRFRRGPEVNTLRLARWLTVLFGAIGTGTALLLAAYGVSSLLDAFREILGLFGGSLAGLFALGVLTRRAHGTGAMIGALTSAVILWFVKGETELHFFLYAAVGTMSCFVIGYAASILIRAPGRNRDGLT